MHGLFYGQQKEIMITSQSKGRSPLSWRICCFPFISSTWLNLGIVNMCAKLIKQFDWKNAMHICWLGVSEDILCKLNMIKKLL